MPSAHNKTFWDGDKLFMKNKMLVKAIKTAIIFLTLIIVCPYSVNAEDNSYTYDVFMDFDTSDADMAADNPYGIGIKQTADEFINGNFSFGKIIDSVMSNFFSDIKSQLMSMKKIIALIIVCGLLKSISSSFGEKSVNELCFFICCSIIVYIVMTSFVEETSIVKENIKRFANINYAMLPAYASISVMTGKTVSVMALSATIMGFSTIVSGFLCSVFVPVTIAAAGLDIINNIFDDNMFLSLSKLIKYILSMLLKIIGLAFVFVVSFQKLGTSAASSFALKAAKNATGFVPIVGDILSGSVQTVADAGTSIGNAVAAACAVVAIVLSAAPVLRLVAVFLAFKITAAITEPAGEKRVTKALNSISDYFSILIGAVFLSAVMFIFSAVILAASF